MSKLTVCNFIIFMRSIFFLFICHADPEKSIRFPRYRSQYKSKPSIWAAQPATNKRLSVLHFLDIVGVHVSVPPSLCLFHSSEQGKQEKSIKKSSEDIFISIACCFHLRIKLIGKSDCIHDFPKTQVYFLRLGTHPFIFTSNKGSFAVQTVYLEYFRLFAINKSAELGRALQASHHHHPANMSQLVYGDH